MSAVSSRHAALALAVIAGVLTAAPSAHAQSDEDPSALVRRGSELARRGDPQGAAEVLRAAIEAQRTGRALAELAYVEQALGRALDAETHLVEAQGFTEERWVRHHRREIEDALAVVRSSIGSVTITANVEGAEVRVNGASVGNAPLREPIRVPTGRCTVEVTAHGYRNASQTVTVLAGEPATAAITLERDAPPPVEAPPPRCAPTFTLRDGLCYPPEPPPDAVSPFRWVTYISGGAAVISAGVAVGLWADGNGVESAYLARCGGANAPASCLDDYTSTQESLSSRAAAVNAMWVISGLTAATAIVSIGLEVRASRRRPTITRVSLGVTPGGVRLSW